MAALQQLFHLDITSAQLLELGSEVPTHKL